MQCGIVARILILVFVSATSTAGVDQEPEANSPREKSPQTLSLPAAVRVASADLGKQDSVTISVMIRASDGTPVQGLTADDFIAEEKGQRYQVEVKRSLRGSPRSKDPTSETQSQSTRGSELDSRSLQSRPGGSGFNNTFAQTHLLLVLPPMHSGTRSFTLNSAIRHIERVRKLGWDVAVLDPSARFMPFTSNLDQVLEVLTQLKIKHDRPQYGTAWIAAARTAIREMGALPGRHVILLACDTESEDIDPDPKSAMHSPTNPWLLRVSPSMFEGDARSATAQIYAVQASGPGVVIPFGGAGVGGVADPVNPGPDILNQISEDNTRLAEQRSELMGTANNSGGRIELDVGAALNDAAKDEAGYYELSFKPDPSMLDGSYHPIAIRVKSPHLRVFASSWYLAPRLTKPEANIAMPAALWKALKSGSHLNGISIASGAWYFPNRSDGLATVPLAAEIVVKPGSSVTMTPPQLAAGLFDERQGKLIGTSTAMLTWDYPPNFDSSSDMLHAYWLNSIDLPPGPYELRVAAIDLATGVVGSSSWRFLIHPPDPGAELAVSSMLLARDCASSATQTSQRRNLLDPLLLHDCRLQPSAAAVFYEDDTISALVRLYPTGNNMKHFPVGWRAHLSCWEVGKSKQVSFSLPIEPTPGSGWAAFAELPVKQLELAPGDYQINIAIAGPHPKQTFSVQSRFQVTAR